MDKLMLGKTDRRRCKVKPKEKTYQRSVTSKKRTGKRERQAEVLTTK